MPSTYTSSLGVEKPANGEKRNTWGTTVNANMDILDRVLSQVGSIALTGSTYTLTTSTSGSLSEGHYSVIKFTGTPGATCTVTISPNDIERIFTIHNATDQSVIMAQGSGSTVTIVAGGVANIYCDGAGSGAAVTSLTGLLLQSVIGAQVQAYSAALSAIAGLTPTDGNFIVGNGSTWVAEGGATALASLGVTASAAELNHSTGVTSGIQTQLNGKQALDATLTALAGLATGANKIPYSTGTDTFGQLDLKDEDDMASNSAAAVPTQQSVKAYTDAAVAAAVAISGSNLASTGYANITGGLQLRWGTGTSTTSNDQSFTFDTAFSTACFGVVALIKDPSYNTVVPVVATTASNFTVNLPVLPETPLPFFYIAVGH